MNDFRARVQEFAEAQHAIDAAALEAIEAVTTIVNRRAHPHANLYAVLDRALRLSAGAMLNPLLWSEYPHVRADADIPEYVQHILGVRRGGS